MATSMNSFFTTLGSSQNSKSDEECSRFINNVFKSDDHLNPRKNLFFSEFSFRPTSSTIIEKLISKLDSGSSAGVTDIATKILKASSAAISPFLVKLLSTCIENSIFPNEFKLAVVTPLFKNKGDADDINNYRGISVLPPVA